ncbi:MAG: hypothetical protein EA413_09555 [Cyanobium sp. PLM2.Bin73]|jgi:hypothetical protein|nr:MAG: hypothetical protein EA413_09555 [Cyanobium sp. PLM2.Bin73]
MHPAPLPHLHGVIPDRFDQLAPSFEDYMHAHGLADRLSFVPDDFTPGTSSERCEPVSPCGRHYEWLD